MDPIGLSLENFDGVGVYRTHENGVPIDASGDLDGKEFTDPVTLGQTVRNHPQLPACLSKRLFEYAARRPLDKEETAWLKTLNAKFIDSDYRLRDLMQAIATSDQFLKAPNGSDTSSREAQ